MINFIWLLWLLATTAQLSVCRAKYRVMELTGRYWNPMQEGLFDLSPELEVIESLKSAF